MLNREEFIAAYIEAALFSTNDESTPSGGEPLDLNYDTDDLAPETRAAFETDCDAFIATLSLPWVPEEDRKIDSGHAGHDFWLTRCGHGAGFWDGDYPEEQGQRLTEICEKFGEVWLYVGDDGKIYSSN